MKAFRLPKYALVLSKMAAQLLLLRTACEGLMKAFRLPKYALVLSKMAAQSASFSNSLRRLYEGLSSSEIRSCFVKNGSTISFFFEQLAKAFRSPKYALGLSKRIRSRSNIHKLLKG